MTANQWRHRDGSIRSHDSCAHRSVQTEHVLRSTEWSTRPGARSREIELPGLAIERCAHCQAIRLKEPASDRTIEGVLEALAQAGVTRPPGARSRAPATSWQARAAELRLADVIVPSDTRQRLDEVLAKIRHHALIYEEWGFGEIDKTGRAATLCLYGPPGTGKTRAAEALAGELRLPLLVVAGGDIESRYLGDSARNVREVFAAARDQGAALLFDEADSLFGRRASDVTQGVDHEVNITKSTLLIEVERFPGLLMLATNFERNLDPAFRRRISWHVELRKPDEAARRLLWKLHLGRVPLASPADEIITAATAASDQLTGGDILVAMRLALAAVACARGRDGRLSADHLVAACQAIRRAEADLRGAQRTAAQIRQVIGGEAPALPLPPAPDAREP
jgi:AAA+ superfamily predicted ATPase